VPARRVEPIYRVHTDPPELLEADSCRVGGIMTLYEDHEALEGSRDAARTLRELIEQRMDLRRRPVVRESAYGRGGRCCVRRPAALGTNEPGGQMTARPDRNDRGGTAAGFLIALVIVAVIAVAAFFFFGGSADIDVNPPAVDVSTSPAPEAS
jgi:hypothetical protein